MYLQTGLVGVFKPRPRYRLPQLTGVQVDWNLEVPFRKDFGAFRQELSKAIGQLVTAATDKTESDRIMLKEKSMEVRLKEIHVRLLKRRSPKLKEEDPVGINAVIRFKKTDFTDVSWIIVIER